jgi:hypothetical protein
MGAEHCVALPPSNSYKKNDMKKGKGIKGKNKKRREEKRRETFLSFGGNIPQRLYGIVYLGMGLLWVFRALQKEIKKEKRNKKKAKQLKGKTDVVFRKSYFICEKLQCYEVCLVHTATGN